VLRIKNGRAAPFYGIVEDVEDKTPGGQGEEADEEAWR
jgi:hypothetical protein